MTENPTDIPSDVPAGAEESEPAPLTIDQAIENLQGSDLGLRMYAAWWLGRFRVSQSDAIQALISALEDTEDRTEAGGYPLRRNAARALGKLGDRRAVSPLVQCLDCTDYYVREAAAQALGALGDSSCSPHLLNLLQQPGEPETQTDAPMPQPYDAILEALGALQATDAAPVVKRFLSHEVDRVRFSAIRAMYQLSSTVEEAHHYGEMLMQALSHPKLQLRRAAMADLGAMGYLKAAEPIAKTLAENSLKLIALQGILEHHLQTQPNHEISDEAIAVMTLMDELL
ncbi:MAG: HEAT repeat domain-containing protein [Leptolyngbyaceae bacterium]|nr:HEAT repeat domain-containing protein [Leptolyngbyaceae bacterium]